ncbi:MAG: GNAT family N-acetyltransferase [Pseudomonadota bacterium]
MKTSDIRHAEFPRDMPELTRLCHAYRAQFATLGPEVVRAIDTFYPLETYDALIASLPEKHARPKGCIVVVEAGDVLLGCGMIQPINDADAEIKRVFIDPVAQGTGVGARLSQMLIDQARADGYARILLDTTRVSTPAQRLYEKLGFAARGPYAEMPDDMENVLVYYEMKL